MGVQVAPTLVYRPVGTDPHHHRRSDQHSGHMWDKHADGATVASMRLRHAQTLSSAGPDTPSTPGMLTFRLTDLARFGRKYSPLIVLNCPD